MKKVYMYGTGHVGPEAMRSMLFGVIHMGTRRANKHK